MFMKASGYKNVYLFIAIMLDFLPARKKNTNIISNHTSTSNVKDGSFVVMPHIFRLLYIKALSDVNKTKKKLRLFVSLQIKKLSKNTEQA